MRNTVSLLALLAVAFALDGKSGYQATSLFTAADVQAAVQYDASFAGVRWDTLAGFRLGSPWSGNRGPQMAVDGDGVMYFLAAADGYTGLIRYDGATYGHLVQTPPNGFQTGLRKVVASPVTHGLITADHPVYLTKHAGQPLQLMTVDPDTAPYDEVPVHVFASGTFVEDFDVDAGGRIYALLDDSILELTYNASTGGYDEATVPGGAPVEFTPGLLNVGPDGSLYHVSSAGDRSRDVVRIDPATGAWSVHGTLHKDVDDVNDWAWDTDGSLWLGVTDHHRKGTRHYVVELAGGTTSYRDRIGESSNRPMSVAAGVAGKLYVLENVDFGLADEMFELAPGSGGDDGGGGGKGGGKGKNK